ASRAFLLNGQLVLALRKSSIAHGARHAAEAYANHHFLDRSFRHELISSACEQPEAQLGIDFPVRCRWDIGPFSSTPTHAHHFHNQLMPMMPQTLLDAAAAFGLVAIAELGDKSQLVCMGLAARHRAVPVLAGAVVAFALLNL